MAVYQLHLDNRPLAEARETWREAANDAVSNDVAAWRLDDPKYGIEYLGLARIARMERV